MSTIELEPAPRPAGEPWLRTAEVIGVSFPKREIELIVIPYDTPTMVKWENRVVEETIAPGAFDGIQRRANRIRVNREHERLHTVGHAAAFYPSRTEGLVARLQISRTQLGEETLTLADEGDLDASAGFRPMDGGMSWEGRSRYRVTKAWLAHIAMTSDPAYPQAKVLAVRNTTPTADRAATPVRDALEQRLLEERYAAIDQKYGVSNA